MQPSNLKNSPIKLRLNRGMRYVSFIDILKFEKVILCYFLEAFNNVVTITSI